jgi:hypothetical protein
MLNYESVKLEKGLYHLANRTFTEALEAADPSPQYAGTELAGLDAFERQLKRFDIRVGGADCDKVEKFFTTTESAVLFPEFVRSAVKRGLEESILPELTAAVSAVKGTSCKGFFVDETDGSYSDVTPEGENLTKTVITEGDAVYACRLVKYLVGDLIRAVKETVAENNDEKAKKRILQIVAASGGGGISKRDLTRKTQFIRKSFRDEYVADLVESGEIVVKFGANGGEVYFPGD